MTATSDERVLRRAAFITLFGVLSGHALLETARDTLFLTNIPAAQLPLAYLLIAGVALTISQLPGTRRSRHSRLRRLQLVAAVGTLGFWWLTDTGEDWVYYALYVWSGSITTLIVGSFWLALGDLLTITQAKRLYASITTGGALGALAGFGLATAVTVYSEPELLIVLAAAAFAVSALGQTSLGRPASSECSEGDLGQSAAVPVDDRPPISECLTDVASHKYARRVALVVILASMTATFADFLFKSELAARVPAEQLGVWFAGVYLVLNASSLLVLLFGVTRAIERLSMHRALAVLPMLMAAAAVGILLGGALLSVLLLKAADGALRHSLQRTTTELLFVPLPASLRKSVKTFADMVGQHLAKAAAAATVLLLMPLDGPGSWIAGAVLILAVVWAAAALSLREPYLDMFRQTLRDRTIETRIAFPELDLASLETLIHALSHPDDRHVLAALDLLAAQDRVDLIPSLILYHPSSDVVVRALSLLAGSGRQDFAPLVPKLMEHAEAEIRAASVRASWILEPQRDTLEELARSECPCIHISAIVGLRVHGWLDAEAAALALEAAVLDLEPDTRMALANAIRLRHCETFRAPLLTLSRDADAAVRAEAVAAIRASEDPYYTPHLVSLLDDRAIREGVRTALRERGDDALAQLERALEDSSQTPAAVCRHVPRTVSGFGSRRGAEILLRHLNYGDDGTVRYKILLGLATLFTDPNCRGLDEAPLLEASHRTLSRTLRLVHWQAELARAQREEPARRTPSGKLLGELLADKEQLALERLVRLAYLRRPDEDFQHFWSGLRSTTPKIRASSLELLAGLLAPDVARAVIPLLDRSSHTDVLTAAHSPLANQRLAYPELLWTLAEDDSRSLRGIALYHIAELALVRPGDAPGEEPEGAVARLRSRALALLERLPDGRVVGPVGGRPADA